MTGVKSYLKENALWLLLIILGSSLRLWQYFFNRSLWKDEASLALNLLARSFVQLSQPLDYEQGAPIGFLWIIKSLTVFFGNYDYVLRMFPMIAGILSLVFLMRVAKTGLGNAGLVALAVWAICPQPIYYSNELKQYGTDAMVVLLLLYFATQYLDDPENVRKLVFLGVVGVFAIWVSHPSVFVLAAFGSVIFIQKIRGIVKTPFVWIFFLGGVWVLSFALEYFVSLQYLVANDYLMGYWKKAFMPLPPWSNKRWFLNTYFFLVSMTMNTTAWYFSLTIGIMAAIGAISLLVRKMGLGLLIFLTFAFACLASALQKYPLRERFMLFMAPLFLILIAESIRWLYKLSYRYFPRFSLFLPLIISLLIISRVKSGINIFNEPLTRAEIKPVMAYIAQNDKQEDTIYVYYTSETSFLYYTHFYDVDHGNIILGYRAALKKESVESFYDDVDELRGRKRVWFIFSDVVSCGGCDGDMYDYYRDYLDKLGVRLQTIETIGARGYLYDLYP
jgi:hypothetical protein